MSNQVKTSGAFLVQDKLGKPVILEWIQTSILSPEYATGMKSIAEIASQAFAAVELQFLQAHPEAVKQDEYLQHYIPFFQNGIENVDWQAVEGTIKLSLKQMHEMDFSKYGPDILKPFINDVYFFVVAKNQATAEPLGYINFSVSPEYAHDDIKVTGIGIVPSAQNSGLGKLLMSSIFTINPSIKRIFLSTRITNNNALRAYRSWGFMKDANPIEEPHMKIIKDHWVFMEYKVEHSDIVQKTAERLISLNKG
ncbi:MAG: GNAT family N-acetyltransferase [Candidatus Dependentiae bacterium]|nr:GNAT family N-acetyltransferase [Candidatus Dependentiae bacterium]